MHVVFFLKHVLPSQVLMVLWKNTHQCLSRVISQLLWIELPFPT